MEQDAIDQKNISFWDELCGSHLASALGIREISPASLKIFDDYYMDFYPYLASYVTRFSLKNTLTLEIGLGYGTLGQFLALQGCQYHGLDIAQGPVDMMRYRLSCLGLENKPEAQAGSALDIPYPDQKFDYVYSIGCLHHTGDIPKAVSEIYRVLAPGGRAIIMLYNRASMRLWFTRLLGKNLDQSKALYDANADGETAPYIEFVTKDDVQVLFKDFANVSIDIQNFDNFNFKGWNIIPRNWLLASVAPFVGLDLYIVAQK